MKVKRPPFSLDTSEPGVFRLMGELSVYGISDLWPVFHEHLPTEGRWVIDCRAVTLIDTAGISVLISALRYAHQQHLQFTIQGLPEEARTLMQVHGVLSLFDQNMFRSN